MEYQLFLPAGWATSGTDTFPVVVFLHGAGDGKFSVMNSQSLPRLLHKDQSTCFDARTCWCLSQEYEKATAMREASADSEEPFLLEEEDIWSPMVDCDFSANFGGIVVMPQGWLPSVPTGWTEEKLSLVEALTRFVLQEFRGDATRVTLTGQSAGGAGAWQFAASRPRLWAAVIIVCMPDDPSLADELEGLPIWVAGWTGDGLLGNDDMVRALKLRKAGSTRYTRYTRAPAPPDPLYNAMENHASYDLIYRDPRLWSWAFAQRSEAAVAEWHLASRPSGSVTGRVVDPPIGAGPSTPEAVACAKPIPVARCRSSEDEPEPFLEREAPGRRVRMPAFQGMEYQLFLPASWNASRNDTYPVVVFLHGAGDGKFSVMNSQSLPRLLRKDQSTCFDARTCWCLGREYENATAMREANSDVELPFLEEEEDLRSPMADCDFAETFGAIVVMPQGWLPTRITGWTPQRLLKVESLVRSILRRYRGDPERVVLTGQSAGGRGAWNFAAQRPHLWAAVSIVCMPTQASIAVRLEGLPIWVVGWTGDGKRGNDAIVVALKKRKRGSVRYTRYLKAPAPPDPLYRKMANHASYDLIYRDPRHWQWAFSQRSAVAAAEWQAGA